MDSEVSPKTSIIDLFMTTDKLGNKEICKSCFYLLWCYPGRSFSVHKHLSCSPDPAANSPAAGFVALTQAQLLWLPPVPGTVSTAHSAALQLPGVQMLWATIKPSGLSLVGGWIANPFLSHLKSLLCLLNSKSPLQSPILAPCEGIKRERRKVLPLQGKKSQNKPQADPTGWSADSCCPPTQASCPWRIDFAYLLILWMLLQKTKGQQSTKRAAVTGKLVINSQMSPR